MICPYILIYSNFQQVLAPDHFVLLTYTEIFFSHFYVNYRNKFEFLLISRCYKQLLFISDIMKNTYEAYRLLGAAVPYRLTYRLQPEIFYIMSWNFLLRIGSGFEISTMPMHFKINFLTSFFHKMYFPHFPSLLATGDLSLYFFHIFMLVTVINQNQ